MVKNTRKEENRTLLTMREFLRSIFFGSRRTTMLRTTREPASFLYSLAVIVVIGFRSVW